MGQCDRIDIYSAKNRLLSAVVGANAIFFHAACLRFSRVRGNECGVERGSLKGRGSEPHQTRLRNARGCMCY